MSTEGRLVRPFLNILRRLETTVFDGTVFWVFLQNFMGSLQQFWHPNRKADLGQTGLLTRHMWKQLFSGMSRSGFPRGTGPVGLCLHTHRTERGMCMCVKGFILRNWHTWLWKLASLEFTGHASRQPTQAGVEAEFLLCWETCFSVKTFNCLDETHLHYRWQSLLKTKHL